MTDTTDFPALPGHPEHTTVWTEPEKRVIAEYAEQCVQVDRASRAPAQDPAAAQAPQAAEPVALVDQRNGTTVAWTRGRMAAALPHGTGLYLAPQAPAAPISAATEATMALAIQFEKLLCAKLGDDWHSGVSVQSLLDRLVPVHAPAAQPLTQLELDGIVANVMGYKNMPPPYIGHLIARAVEAHHGIGIAPSAQGETKT